TDRDGHDRGDQCLNEGTDHGMQRTATGQLEEHALLGGGPPVNGEDRGETPGDDRPEHPHQWDGSDEHRHVDKEAGETIDGLASAGDIREGGAVLQLLIHPRGAYCGNVVSHDVWNPL